LRPTVTDGDLLLGRLDPHNFAGGAIVLNTQASATAMVADIGSKLGLDAQDCAYGLSEVVDENMANAARAHAVENGRAIDEFTMIAFGGAAPIHAARLGEKLGIDKVLIPASAGVGSAVGFLKAPFGYEVIRSSFKRVDSVSMDEINEVFDEISRECQTFLDQGADSGEPTWERRAYMRYVGQGWEIPVVLPVRTYTEDDRAALKDLFSEAYRRFFGRSIETLPVQIVSFTVKASSPLPPVTRLPEVKSSKVVTSSVTRALYDCALNQEVKAQIHERNSLNVGDCVEGPAIIVEAETATVVTSSYAATMQADRSLLLETRVS
jgi:N-methylhydantoinase A